MADIPRLLHPDPVFFQLSRLSSDIAVADDRNAEHSENKKEHIVYDCHDASLLLPGERPPPAWERAGAFGGRMKCMNIITTRNGCVSRKKLLQVIIYWRGGVRR